MRLKILNSESYVLHSNASRRGQSLMEILVGMAIGIFLIVAGVGLIVPSLNTNTQVTNVQRGAALAKELLDNVRVWSEGNWHNIFALATGTANPYYLNVLQSPFTAATGTELVASNPVTSGLVGWWKFDEGTGTVAYDSSGNNVSGTWTGTATGTSGYYSAGKVGQWAGAFDGISTYDSVSSTPSLGGATKVTLSAWVYLKSLPSGSGGACPANTCSIIFQRASSYAVNGYFWAEVKINGSNYGFRADVEDASLSSHVYASSAYNLILNTWNFVTIVADTNTITVYANGIAGTPVSYNGLYPLYSGPYSSLPRLSYIGASYYSTSSLDFLNGYIDDVRIYNRALSAAEVNQIYTSQVFTRYFYVNDVYRNGGNIVTGGGSYDPSTKQITAAYSWIGGGATDTISMYLTRNRDNVYNQTDWSGGPGASSSATSVGNKFATSSNINYTTTTGSIYINL